MALSKDDVVRIAKGFIEILRRSHDVRQAYLFGSFVKGAAKDYSDIDLAIIFGSLDVSEGSPFGEDFRIFHAAQKYNSLLEVVCFLQEEFEKDGGTLVRLIKREGVRLV